MIEIKNNMYEAIPILGKDGTKIIGSRLQKDKRRIRISESDVNINQLRNLEKKNIISIKKVK